MATMASPHVWTLLRSPLMPDLMCCRIRQAMKKIGLKTPPSGTAETMEQADEIAAQIGSYPLIIRPAFTLGGSGGGIAYNVEEFHEIVESGLQASVTTQAWLSLARAHHVQMLTRCLQAIACVLVRGDLLINPTPP